MTDKLLSMLPDSQSKHTLSVKHCVSSSLSGCLLHLGIRYFLLTRKLLPLPKRLSLIHEHSWVLHHVSLTSVLSRNVETVVLTMHLLILLSLFLQAQVG